jgi:hypothetical protein
MKRLIALLLLCIGAFVAGCGMVDTYQQRETRICNIIDYDMRMAVDDSDMIWLVDRPSYLSYWHLREAN